MQLICAVVPIHIDVITMVTKERNFSVPIPFMVTISKAIDGSFFTKENENCGD